MRYNIYNTVVFGYTVSATHRSTKQFFSLYNSLEDTKRYLEKELSLLNSIVDSFQL